MIEIHCTKCKTLLQIDDAFAGGVCRCRHCGAIQTVPKRLKNKNQGAVAGAAVGSSKSSQEYQNKAGLEAGSGTGLDELAGIVASSGLSSSRLRKKEKPPAGKTAPAKDQRTLIIIASAAGVIVLLLAIIIFMATRDKTGGGNDVKQTYSGTGGATNGVAPGTGGADSGVPKPGAVIDGGTPVAVTPKIIGPSFLGQALNESSVAYVLDRGAASGDERRLELLKGAVLNSVRSLGPTRKFAVVFWQVEGSNIEAWPEEGLRNATPDNVEELRKFLDDIFSVGQTKAPSSTERAFQTGAQAIVLVPIKTFIEPGSHTAIVKSRGQSTAKVYNFTLAQPDIGESFRKVAADTHGTYRDVSMVELREAAK